VPPLLSFKYYNDKNMYVKNEIVINSNTYLSTFKNHKLGLLSLKKYKNWFPLYSTPALGGIVADITGDGHLGRGLVQFIAKNKYEAIRFKNEIKKLFSLEGKIRRSPSNKNVWECLIGNNALAKILRLSGAPFGEKVMNKFYVPIWILNGNEKIKKRYLQRLFDCEGTVFFQNKKRIRIKIKLNKSLKLIKNHRIFLNQIKTILSEFDIKTTKPTMAGFTKRKDNITTFGLEFEFYGTKKNLLSVINFQKRINFENKIKREKLNKYINVLKNTPKLMPS